MLALLALAVAFFCCGGMGRLFLPPTPEGEALKGSATIHAMPTAKLTPSPT